MSAERGQADWRLLRRALPYMRPDAPLYLLALLCAPVSAALAVAQPYLLKVAIDDHILVGDIAGLQQVALLYLGAILAAFLAESLYTVLVSYGAMRTITRLRDRVFRHTLSFARSFFDTRPTGRLLTRATTDVEAIGETLTAGAITIVLDLLLVIAILAAMFALDPTLTLITLLLAPVIALVVDRIRRVLRGLYAKVRDSLAELNAFTSERLAGLQAVQLYADEPRAQAAFDARLFRYRDATIRTNVWDALLYAIMDGLTAIAIALLLWYASGGLVETVATAGLLAAFIDYITRLFRPIQEFSAKVAIVQRAVAALEKILQLLDHREHITPGDTTLDGPVRQVALRDLRFAYGDGPEVLRGVSFDIGPGEVVAVCGRTGSGKTTLARLLTRTYEGYGGEIRLNDIELSGLCIEDVRRNIGLVRQDVQLFPGDVRFNLTLGRDIPDAQLWEVIRLVRAEAAVEKLGGLDGQVAAQGANLSVGEAQLLSFARTMAHDPPMVILDEATASVDTLTEARIQEATRAVFERKMVLVIAHRLSTIVHADRIVVLEQGQVAEMGSHDALLRHDGLYARLFRQQFAAAPGLEEEPLDEASRR